MATVCGTLNPFRIGAEIPTKTRIMAETLTVTDNRTGKQYELPIKDGTIRATDIKQIKSGPTDSGLMTYDPAFLNTAACRSAITYIDGDKGVLEYRAYPIEQLAEHCTYLEVSYLVLFGELPTELASRLDRRDHPPTCSGNVKLMEAFSTPIHGYFHQHRQRPLDSVSRRQAGLRPGIPQTVRADCQGGGIAE